MQVVLLGAYNAVKTALLLNSLLNLSCGDYSVLLVSDQHKNVRGHPMIIRVQFEFNNMLVSVKFWGASK
jgi:hypothetical protein